MYHNQFPIHEEDPLAGDVDKFVHPDETRTDEQIAHDEDVANRLHMSGANNPEDYWAEYNKLYGIDDDHEDYEYVENTLALLLTKTVQDKAYELGKSNADYLSALEATLVLKDGEGNPTDNLIVRLRHPNLRAGYDFDGSTSFRLAPVGVGKDEWGRDLEFVDGNFNWDFINARQEGGYSMTYAGCDPQEYVKSVLTEDTLAMAELVGLNIPTAE